MKKPVDAKILSLAAKLYYVDKLGQEEVARLLSLSQAQVSRLLKKAREKGIVKIEVVDISSGEDETLTSNIKELLNLKYLDIIKVPNPSSI